MCFAPQRRALLPPLNFQKWSEHGVFCIFLLPNLLRVTTFAPPRMVCLPLFTSKCASRHNAVHFLDITTSKSGSTLRCFVHFDFGMCFAPQRRALFSTSQLPKVVRVRCALPLFTSYVLRATTACTFTTSQLPKVVRAWRVLYIFTSKFASRHNLRASENGVFCHFSLPNVLRATAPCTF